MLVLSRRTGEKIVVDGGIVFTVIETSKGKVRIGVEAPECIKIMRSEIIDRDPSKKECVNEIRQSCSSR